MSHAVEFMLQITIFLCWNNGSGHARDPAKVFQQVTQGDGWHCTSASKGSIRRFVITEKAPTTRAFSWLKAPTCAFTFALSIPIIVKKHLEVFMSQCNQCQIWPCVHGEVQQADGTQPPDGGPVTVDPAAGAVAPEVTQNKSVKSFMLVTFCMFTFKSIELSTKLRAGFFIFREGLY